MTDTLAALAAGLLPVLLFLLGLTYLDSYKLVHLRALLLTIAAGLAVAGVSFLINISVLRLAGVELSLVTRYVAPVVEELLKAAVVVWFIRSHRVGFLVDAAIVGFAVGAGFAVAENIYFLNVLEDATFAVWIVRGCGTAIMHGGVMAIFAVLSKALIERRGAPDFLLFLPGLLVAVVVHSFFNHFLLLPVLSTLIVLVGLPPLLLLVFWYSERVLRRWLDVGFDTAAELLRLVHSGEFSESKVGRYLRSLRESFQGAVVADMLCYLRLHLELSLRAKGELMMRQKGFRTELEPEIREKLEELAFLEGSIGRAGRLAIRPVLQVSGRDLWQLYMLGR